MPFCKRLLPFHYFLIVLFVSLFTFTNSAGQAGSKTVSKIDLKKALLNHREFVSIPNLPENKDLMLANINWVAAKYKELGFDASLLESSTLPILLTEKVVNPNYKTVLFYFHIDGQPVNPGMWDQEDPFTPVLKKQDDNGNWQPLDWRALDSTIDLDWRIFARAAADDKAPILMLITALQLLENKNQAPTFNIKVIFDPQEEYGSVALLETIDTYKKRYTSDYFIVMDGPAHDSNKPTLTFGCRGITTCTLTTFGASLPQHSGHFGNYAPNPVFRLSRLLSSMKDEDGKVLIKDYYKGVEILPAMENILKEIPFDATAFNAKLGIVASEKVGEFYHQALQYPSLNVRQIGTSWTGEKLKTVIPEYATASIDVRLVPEIPGEIQVQRIERHLQEEGYYVLDRDPTREERITHSKIVKFQVSRIMNAFRTDPTTSFGSTLRKQLTQSFGEAPITIPMMGGTVPIVPLIEKLDVPTVIIPMVNMDNNQHSPNENIRIGNIIQGINLCLSLLEITLD